MALTGDERAELQEEIDEICQDVDSLEKQAELIDIELDSKRQLLREKNARLAAMPGEGE